MLSRSTFATVLERYIEVSVKNRICQLETSQKQQETQIGQLSKEIQSLQDEESQLKQEMYEALKQLQTQVQNNTVNIKSLESKLDESIPPSVSKSGNDEDILACLIALEEQVRANTEACSEMRQRKTLEDRLNKCEKLIDNLSNMLEKHQPTRKDKARKKTSESRWRIWGKKKSEVKKSSDSSDLEPSYSPEFKHASSHSKPSLGRTMSDNTLTAIKDHEAASTKQLDKKSGSLASLDELI